MRKRVLLLLMVSLLVLSLTSCSLIVKDPEVDRLTVVAEVNGKTISKGEVMDALPIMLEQTAYMYSSYGLPFDMKSQDNIDSALTSIVDSKIREYVLEAKSAEHNVTTFTEDELATMQANAEANYQYNYDFVLQTEFADTTLEGDELKTAVEAKLAEIAPDTTVEAFLENEKVNMANTKLRDVVVASVTVSDEEIQTAYDENVRISTESYMANPSLYGSDVQNGAPVYYTPAGYRYVKHILINFTTEDSEKINALTQEKMEKENQLAQVTNTLAEIGDAVEGEEEVVTQQRTDLVATQETLTKEIETLTTEMAAAHETAIANIQPKVDEVLAKLTEEGADFDALITQYGEDPGMTTEPAKTKGYLISESTTHMVAPFVNAGMSLAKIGDVSEPVSSDYGVHIITYVSDATEGVVALDEVKDALTAELLASKQDTLYAETEARWIEEADAKIHMNRLK